MQNSSNKFAYTWRMLVGCVFFVGMFAVGMPVWGKGVVGYIDAVNGQKWDFSINGSKDDIYSGSPLKEGDVIRVDKQGSSITLILNGESENIHSGKSPYTVELHSRRDRGGFFNLFTNWVSGLFVKDYRRRIAITRGINDNEPPKFAIPILNNGNAKLLEGKRQLYVAWTGGMPDYQVQVYQVVNGRDKEVKELGKHGKHDSGQFQKLEIQEVRLKTWTFEEGERYKIKITNKAGNKSIDTFTVVSDSQDPRQGAKVVMPVSAESSDTKEVEVTLLPSFLLQASWLAQHGNGEWMLEAYQTVASQKNHSAQLVKLGLSLGQVAPRN